MLHRHGTVCALVLCTAFALPACTTVGSDGSAPATPVADSQFEQDRAAILAMAGDFHVTFTFTETVSFVADYEVKPPYLTAGHEIVRVLEDRGDFISMQHILVVGDDPGMPVKHWRQDWQYEPTAVLEFVGGNAWQERPVGAEERRGAWSQTVYQVDDAPRYAAVAAWSHDHGVSEWTSPPSLRPLPRRDATKRDDYHAILAVNRHALTPEGWVHEQDNAKLIQTGPRAADGPQVLVRETAVNSYRAFNDFPVAVAEDYWRNTAAFWADIRDAWEELKRDSGGAFALTIQGEPEPLYIPILELASGVADGSHSVAEATAEARAVIADFTTEDLGSLQDRLAKLPKDGDSIAEQQARLPE